MNRDILADLVLESPEIAADWLDEHDMPHLAAKLRQRSAPPSNALCVDREYWADAIRGRMAYHPPLPGYLTMSSSDRCWFELVDQLWKLPAK